jgi:hypothetical protein
MTIQNSKTGPVMSRWAVFVVICLMLSSGVKMSSVPLERYFFTSVAIVEATIFDDPDGDAVTSLDGLFSLANATPTLLDYRIIRPLVPGSSANDPEDNGRIGAYTLWESVTDYLARPTEFRFDQSQYTIISQEYFSQLGSTDGCHYCEKSSEFVTPSRPVMAHFSNSQSLAAYPIESTFNTFLYAQTSAEPDTLDYVVTHVLTSQPTNQLLPFNFDLLDFWEFYSEPQAFDQHVVNVNNTLQPQAENWFQDLGSLSASWFKVESYTSGCYKCNNNHPLSTSQTRLTTQSSSGSTLGACWLFLGIHMFVFLLIQ